MSDAPPTAPLLTARGLIKRFGRVVALDGCDFDLYPGEILGLIGDNGAGKSTLIKGITGAMTIDAGEVLPGFNDGFKGKAPDLGAYELGEELPHYGPRPEK